MVSDSMPNTPTVSTPVLSTGDFTVLIRYGPNADTTDWGLAFYVAEDTLVEARYRHSQDTEEECVWCMWDTAAGVAEWMDRLQIPGPVLACRVPMVDRTNAVAIIEDAARGSSGSNNGYEGRIGRASINRVLSMLAHEEQPLIEIEDHLQLTQKLDHLEQEFREGQKSGIVDIESMVFRSD